MTRALVALVLLASPALAAEKLVVRGPDGRTVAVVEPDGYGGGLAVRGTDGNTRAYLKRDWKGDLVVRDRGGRTIATVEEPDE